MDKNFKIYKLREMGEEDLSKQLEKFKEELYQLRTSKVVGATATKLGRIKVTPRSKIKIKFFAPPSRENECHKRKNKCHKIRF